MINFCNAKKNKFSLGLLLAGSIPICFGQSNAQNSSQPYTQQSVGKLSPIQNNQNGTNFANYGPQFLGPNFVGIEPAPKHSSLEVKQEALLLAQNPTVLQITGMRWAEWFGDTSPFLSVQLTNLSNLPALDIKVSILNEKTGATLKSLKRYKLSESYAMRILKGTPISVDAKSKSELPLASKEDIESMVKSDCIIGAGLEFTTPHLSENVEIPMGINFSSHQSSIFIQVSYKTIFGQTISSIVLGVIDTASRKSGYMIARGSEVPTSLKCVGDPFWNVVTSSTSDIPIH